MSQANIPNITPTISLSLTQSIPLLLDSIALEELALSHLINAEAEKIQFSIGTLTSTVTLSPPVMSITNLLNVNTGVRTTLQDVIKKEMLLQFKFENVLDLLPATSQIAPISLCGCQVTDFDIARGNGAGNTTVVFNGVTQPPNAHGSVEYVGHMCLNCTSNNEFTFTYGGSANVPAFVFTADTFDVPHCPNNVVTITGTGTTNNPALFGAGPATYTLILNGVMGSKSISLTIVGSNGSTFTATATSLGNGQLSVTDCPS